MSQWNRAAVAVVALLVLVGCGRSPPTEALQPLCGVSPSDGDLWRSRDGGVWALFHDGEHLWAATRDDLVRIDPRTLDCTRFARTEGEPTVPLSDVHALLPDPEGRLWAAGLHGVARFEGGRWQAVLTDVVAVNLAFDAEGNLWVQASIGPGLESLRFPGHEPPPDGQWVGERSPPSPGGQSVCDRWIASSSNDFRPAFSTPEECRLLLDWRSRLASIPPPEGIDLDEYAPITGSKEDVWLLAVQRAVLLHYDGQAWQTVLLPAGYLGGFQADAAQGGVWVGTAGGLVFSDGETVRRFLLTPEDTAPRQRR